MNQTDLKNAANGKKYRKYIRNWRSQFCGEWLR